MQGSAAQQKLELVPTTQPQARASPHQRPAVDLVRLRRDRGQAFRIFWPYGIAEAMELAVMLEPEHMAPPSPFPATNGRPWLHIDDYLSHPARRYSRPRLRIQGQLPGPSHLPLEAYQTHDLSAQCQAKCVSHQIRPFRHAVGR